MNPVNPDLASPQFKADPFDFYARLRAQTPVCRVRLPDRQHAWLLSRYEDALTMLKDERLAKDKWNARKPPGTRKDPWFPAFFKPLTRNMLDVDVPDHTRLRALVQKAFTPRIVERMRGRIEDLAVSLIDQRREKRRMDVIHDFALPIPTTVIAEMLGVPAADQKRFHTWSASITSADPSGWRMVMVIPHVVQFLRYIRRLVKSKRERPEDDLMSALVQAEEAGDKLDEDELVAMIFLLLVAGHETTVNLIGNSILSLLQNPTQLELLRNEPGLILSAVEELLRFNGPLDLSTERYARDDFVLNGMKIERGDLVYASLTSANRDEGQFPQASVLDIRRDPNRHLAFGMGIHYCLGAPLARLEAQIVIPLIIRNIPTLQVMSQKLQWRRSLNLRGLTRLYVAW
jgi:cytochrome P450 PksS